MITKMSFWINQLLQIANNNHNQVINRDLTQKHNDLLMVNKSNLNYQSELDLPDGFELKTLNLSHLDEIFQLINNHYVRDDQLQIRTRYSKDFIYWYLTYIPPGFVIGLCYHSKLVGLITAYFLDMVVHTESMKIPCINFICLQERIRKMGMAKYLMDEMKNRLLHINLNYGFFITKKNLTKNFAKYGEYVIPINYTKLHQVGFLREKIQPISKLESNPLHLMSRSDIETVTPKLNHHLQKYNIRPFFTIESANHFLIPKKNIVYTFVNRNENNIVTDLITIYIKYMHCITLNQTVSVGWIAFYFMESMSLTQLVTYLMDKVVSYDIDQLVFGELMDNMNINITRYSSYDEYYCYLYNKVIQETISTNICVLPF